jgi:hypothetical protein
LRRYHRRLATNAQLGSAAERSVIPSGFVILARFLPWGLGLAAMGLLLALVGEWSVARWS